MSNSNNFMPSYDFLVKTVVVGDSGVGKTCLMRRFHEGVFQPSYMATIGVDFCIKHLSVDGKAVKLQIWDTAGQERFRNITSAYYRGADAVLVVFDVTDVQSFKNVKYWIDEVHRFTHNTVPIVLVANKCDMRDQRVVDAQTVEDFASELGIKVLETSAKTADKVQETFETLSRAFIRERSQHMPANNNKRGKVQPSPADVVEEDSLKLFRRCCAIM